MTAILLLALVVIVASVTHPRWYRPALTVREPTPVIRAVPRRLCIPALVRKERKDVWQ
jgi:hypothetical protein